MKRRTPFRLLALFAVVAAFALTVLPVRAGADTEIYSKDGMRVWAVADPGIDSEDAISVTVKVNDEIVAPDISVTGLKESATRLYVTLPEGYGSYISDASGFSSTIWVDSDGGYFNLYRKVLEDSHSLTLNIFQTRFETSVGTIECAPATGEGYNLTARIFVNGQLEFTTPQLRVAGSAPGGFTLEEAEGLYYNNVRPQVAYDFHTASGAGTWTKTSGTVTFGGEKDRDHNNVLDIFLTTFEDYAYLDVNRGAGVDISDNMVGYRVTYELDGKRYSYLVTSFDTEDSQIIPKGVPVTIEAVCKTGWEVTEWSISSSINNEFESLGNSAVLTTNVGNGESIVVTATHVCPMPEKPTFDEVEDIFGNELVMVECVNATIDPVHEDKTYGPIAGGVEIGDVVNNNGTYNVTLTVTAPTTAKTAIKSPKGNAQRRAPLLCFLVVFAMVILSFGRCRKFYI